MRVWIFALLWASLAGCAHSPAEMDPAPGENRERPVADDAMTGQAAVAAEDDDWGEDSTPFSRGNAGQFEDAATPALPDADTELESNDGW